jgi:hypothetical protein
MAASEYVQQRGGGPGADRRALKRAAPRAGRRHLESLDTRARHGFESSVREPAAVKAALNKPFPRFQNKTELERAREYYRRGAAADEGLHVRSIQRLRRALALDICSTASALTAKAAIARSTPRTSSTSGPRAGVTESPKHPGYWWLAADWSNLLPKLSGVQPAQAAELYQPGMNARTAGSRPP